MTTIAYRDGILAADSASWDANGIYFGRTRKIHKLADGSLLAGAGSNSMLLRVVNWLNHDCDFPDVDPEKETDRFQGLLIEPGRRVFYMDQSLEQSEFVDLPFVAIGSGRELALGAMAMGATAREAVMIACQFDAHSRGPVDVEAMPPLQVCASEEKPKPQSPAQEAALTCYWAASDPFQAKVARALMLLSGLSAE